MLRVREVISAIYRRWVQRANDAAPVLEGDLVLMTRLASAIHTRQLSGEKTTLRQLHTICEMEQQQALAVLAQMRMAKIVSIEQNVSDEFESLVILSEDASLRLSQSATRNAA